MRPPRLGPAVTLGLAAAAGSIVASWWAGDLVGQAPGRLGVLADLELWARAFRSASLPLWNAYDGAGYPPFARAGATLFDPLSWAFAAWGAAVGVSSWTVVLECAAWMGLGAAGWSAWLGEHRLPAWVRAWVVIVWVAGPQAVAVREDPALWPLGLLGWALWGVERMIGDAAPRSGLAFGLWVGWMIHACEPQVLGPALAVVGAYVVPSLAQAWRSNPAARPGPGHAAAWGVAAGVVAIAVLGRMAGAAAWTDPSAVATESTLLPLQGRDAWGLWAPRAARAWGNPYLGVLGVVGLGLAAQQRDWRPWWWAGTGVAVWLGSVSLGGVRIAVVCGLVAAAWGLAQLEVLKGVDRRRRPVGVAVVVALVARAWLSDAPSLWASAGAGLGAAAVLLAAFAGPTGRTLARWAIPVVAVIELGASTPRGRAVRSPASPSIPSIGAKAAARVVQGGRFRIADFVGDGPRPGVHLGVRELARRPDAFMDERFAQTLRAAPHATELLRALNVAGVWYRRPGAAVAYGLDPIRGEHQGYRVQQPWPRAFWTDDVRSAEDHDHVLLDLMKPGAPRAVFERSAARSSDGAPSVSPRPFVQAQVVPHGSWGVDVNVVAPGPGEVVLAEPFAPGWVVTESGREVRSRRVNGSFCAVRVDAGRHELRWRYRPRGVRLTWALWMLAWAVALGARVRDAVRSARAARR